MANRATAFSPRHRGWFLDQVNGRLAAVYNGTEIFDFDGNDMSVAQNLVAAGTFGATGVATMSAELRVATGFNVRIGGVDTFVTTQPTNSLVMKTGVEAVGAITTSAALSTDGTVMRKVIAAGTASNVET